MGIMDTLISAVQELKGWPEKIRGSASDLANSYLAKHLGVDGAILSGGNFLADKTLEFCKKVEPVTYARDLPERLEQGEHTWREIQHQWSLVAGGLTDANKMNTDYYWKGVAADAYKLQRKAQVDAANQMSKIAGDMADTLVSLKTNANTFVLTLGGAVLSAIAALGSAMAGSEFPPSAPVLYGIAAVALAGTAALVYAAYDAFESFTDQLKVAIAKLDSDLANASVFPNDSWPAPNGSLYAHKTGWTLNQ